MTEEQVKAAAVRVVQRSTQEQGLPFHVENPALLAAVAALLWPVPERARKRATE
jgi:hypothetical protein